MNRAATSVLLLVLVGCSTQTPGSGKPSAPFFVRPAHVREPMATCAQATRAASAALLQMGYSVTTVEPAKPTVPGKVAGTRNPDWTLANPESGNLYCATVIITCSDTGAEFDAVTDEGVTTQLTFGQKFAAALKEQVNRKVTQPKPSAEPAAELALTVEPIRSGAAQRDLGLDLPAAGITPVKFEIVNRSARRFRFRADGVEMTTEQGTRATPLTLTTAAARVANQSARAGVVEAALRPKTITDADLLPGGTLVGYLYFNASTYRRARVVLTDLDNDEPEGFSIEF